MISPKDVLEALRRVPYPGFSRDIVSFGLVKDIEIGGQGVTFTLVPSTPDPEVLGTIQERIAEIARELGLGPAEFVVEEPPKGGLGGARAKARIDGVRHVIAVASGKGGVGKSTVAANLALSFRALGRRVGLLDADVYGPSIPVLLELDDRPSADEQKRIQPAERHGIKVISMGLFTEPGKPIIWRGPMVTKLLVEFVRNVVWGELDVLVLDLPPGTGDAQLTICQQVPLDGGVIVTTPQEVALLDVKRGVTMFRDANVPVIGVVANMTEYTCRSCGHRVEPFGHGGPEVIAAELGLAVLGSIPLDRDLGGSAGPIVVANPDHASSREFREMAIRIEAELDRSSSSIPTHIHG